MKNGMIVLTIFFLLCLSASAQAGQVAQEEKKTCDNGLFSATKKSLNMVLKLRQKTGCVEGMVTINGGHKRKIVYLQSTEDIAFISGVDDVKKAIFSISITRDQDGNDDVFINQPCSGSPFAWGDIEEVEIFSPPDDPLMSSNTLYLRCSIGLLTPPT